MSAQTTRISLQLITAALVVLAGLAIVALGGGPDVLGDAHSLALGLCFVAFTVVQRRGHRSVTGDPEPRVLLIGAVAAGLLVVIGLGEVLF